MPHEDVYPNTRMDDEYASTRRPIRRCPDADVSASLTSSVHASMEVMDSMDSLCSTLTNVDDLLHVEMLAMRCDSQSSSIAGTSSNDQDHLRDTDEDYDTSDARSSNFAHMFWMDLFPHFVAPFLTVDDLLRIARVCRRAKYAAELPFVWRCVATRDFGLPVGDLQRVLRHSIMLCGNATNNTNADEEKTSFPWRRFVLWVHAHRISTLVRYNQRVEMNRMQSAMNSSTWMTGLGKLSKRIHRLFQHGCGWRVEHASSMARLLRQRAAWWLCCPQDSAHHHHQQQPRRHAHRLASQRDWAAAELFVPATDADHPPPSLLHDDDDDDDEDASKYSSNGSAHVENSLRAYDEAAGSPHIFAVALHLHRIVLRCSSTPSQHVPRMHATPPSTLTTTATTTPTPGPVSTCSSSFRTVLQRLVFIAHVARFLWVRKRGCASMHILRHAADASTGVGDRLILEALRLWSWPTEPCQRGEEALICAEIAYNISDPCVRESVELIATERTQRWLASPCSADIILEELHAQRVQLAHTSSDEWLERVEVGISSYVLAMIARDEPGRASSAAGGIYTPAAEALMRYLAVGYSRHHQSIALTHLAAELHGGRRPSSTNTITTEHVSQHAQLATITCLLQAAVELHPLNAHAVVLLAQVMDRQHASPLAAHTLLTRCIHGYASTSISANADVAEMHDLCGCQYCEEKHPLHRLHRQPEWCCVPAILLVQRSHTLPMPAALADLDEASLHHPRLSFPYQVRAAVAMDRGDVRAAIMEMERILQRTMKTTDAALLLRFVLDAQGRGEAEEMEGLTERAQHLSGMLALLESGTATGDACEDDDVRHRAACTDFLDARALHTSGMAALLRTSQHDEMYDVGAPLRSNHEPVARVLHVVGDEVVAASHVLGFLRQLK